MGLAMRVPVVGRVREVLLVVVKERVWVDVPRVICPVVPAMTKELSMVRDVPEPARVLEASETVRSPERETVRSTLLVLRERTWAPVRFPELVIWR